MNALSFKCGCIYIYVSNISNYFVCVFLHQTFNHRFRKYTKGKTNTNLRVQNKPFSEEKGFILCYTEKEV